MQPYVTYTLGKEVSEIMGLGLSDCGRIHEATRHSPNIEHHLTDKHPNQRILNLREKVKQWQIITGYYVVSVIDH